ncbi:indolepyruvate ferredoxin oxidoreductase family protein [Bordetella hinzii]|uniref:indolepyruvate ferredoxin oxidoreductase family protein n=1 Tax=Bordetella hinzii TaxID=103855 RepID=UPI00045ADB4E|nr:indolepyruvate ferredoxin oxidoreductase family protein [Bordetella hinzii]KCB27663.1 2-oxoacid:ferredoxin/flavodoxin oxidoreductase, gamma subunit [Bordetella hinzii CA90 BAL1384]KCB45329.1 2-oxoacid:ferredoxin/flavodoxin oxidoreductase, gamma subunit [Bordetella hinzii 5132]KCB50519.1 2-oxoacid:ferredoxin/flavodoxin oxidoreductase, gamma subunit [Bordetella hinzii 1277]QDJ32709.1 pyruvate ferredoxin oxidoreductase [Bordetella hinzii]QDJ46387.1 pyruvate ferredoxin oxidoreductase [Bordetell
MDGTPAVDHPIDLDYQLGDNLSRSQGRIFLTGTQALVRIMLAQRRADRERGLNTAGFVSGYRGSPLGGVDMAMWKAQKALDANQITFLPAINEDLAATAVMGTQQVGARADRKVDGVYAMWYGKGPGLDRAGDALHHGHAAGASRHGGVLMVVGDDHTAVSSSIPHSSETSLIGWHVPIVHPASIDEYETFALWGWALSRHSGAWVAFKVTSESVETGQSFEARPAAHYDMPEDEDAAGREYNASDFLSPAIEARMARRLRAVAAFAARHSIDQLISPAPGATIGIVTVGKAHLDAMEALARLGVDTRQVRLYKPGLVWPLERERLLAFAQGLRHILVIEEKDGIVEAQIKDLLYNRGDRPSVCGKRGFDGETLIPAAGQLRPSILAAPLAGWLQRTAGLALGADSAAFACAQALSNEADGMRRRPYFCSGCPHNSSTKVPEGSQARSGVGCHYMAAWMDRETGGLTQMGGEGVDWIGVAPYIESPHVFQNMGEGTYYHSGYLAIRQAVAARANITYKILFNDAVAMTGGQPVDGPISVPQICQQLRGEHVARIVVTTDEPDKYRGIDLGPGIAVHHRRELDALQRELRATPGVTVLIHDQTCAAEKRRRRKKKTFPDPARRLFINSAVCEGCGDCGTQSNCLSIVPLETPYGRKRAVDQSSCNKDYSCAEGFCPSFVSVEGGQPRKRRAAGRDWQARLGELPMPSIVPPQAPYRLLVAGMGGTGVITIGALVSMAAHLQGLSASVLDLTGLAQKGGTVISHIRLAPAGTPAGPARLDWQQADAAILCDPVAAVAPEALGTLRRGHSRVTANTYVAPVSDFTRQPDVPMRGEALLEKIRHAAGDGQTAALDAHGAALTLFGDSILSNVFLLGYAWQRGDVPLTLAALTRAIELNGVAVASNQAAFDAGRLAAHAPQALDFALQPPAQVIALHRPERLEEAVARRVADLTAYQDAAYAARYRQLVEEVAARERALGAGPARLALAVARGLFKLMAYKDEYEVARLYTDGSFAAQLAEQFEGEYRLRFHMAPPLLARKDPRTGVPRKMALGPRTLTALRWLARCKRVRGTWADPFGYTAERRMERALIREYEALVRRLLAGLSVDKIGAAATIAGLAENVRGYGHIKAAAVARFRQERDRLLESYERPDFAPTEVRRSA